MYRIGLLLFLATGCNLKDVADPDDLTDDTGDDINDGDPTPVWDDVRHQTSETFNDAYADGSGLYVVSTEGQSWHHLDGNWSNIPIDVDEEDLNGLWGTGAGATLTMVAVGNGGTKASWDGVLWNVEVDGAANFLSIDGPSVNNLIAIAGNGAHSNGGGSWVTDAVDGAKFDDIWFDGTTGVAVGENGSIGHFFEGEWTIETHESEADLHGVSGTNPSDVWAVGEQGTVLHWNGETWQQIDLGTRASMWSVWAPVGNVAYMVGANGLTFRVQGSLVEELPTGVDNTLYGITGTTEANIWAVGSKGMTLHYTGN